MAVDWSAIFAGIAAFVSIVGLIYSVRQHRDNIRKEFILWALQEIKSPAQRESRKYLWFLDREENSAKKKKLIDGIKKDDPKIIDSEDYGKIRSMLALFNEIGYFWSKARYGDIKDARALFPQIPSTWKVAKPYIDAIRTQPNQEGVFGYFEIIAKKLDKSD